MLCLIKSLSCSSDCFITAQGNKVFQREFDAYIIFQIFCYVFLTQLNQGISQNLLERLVCLSKKVNVIKMDCSFCIICGIFYTLAKIFTSFWRIKKINLSWMTVVFKTFSKCFKVAHMAYNTDNCVWRRTVWKAEPFAIIVIIFKSVFLSCSR